MLKSLLDVAIEFNLKTISITKTENLGETPWKFITNKIKEIFSNMDTIFIVCKSLVRIPLESERHDLIKEYHTSSVNGHKGVTKTYNRLRHNFHWNTMKRDVQEYIQKCRNCQIKKLVRTKTKQPMILTDTPGAAFDKVAMDVVGPLHRTDKGNTHILTIQDLLTKYSVAIPL